MADIRPFAAYRPRKDNTKEIASLPYDVYNREESAEYVKAHPGCFLAIDRPETFFDASYDMYAPEVYERGKEELWKRIDAGDFVQDDAPCYYLYEQTFRGRTQSGIVALASIDDYKNNIVKKHENTTKAKEEDRVRHVTVCQAQTGPIFLCYRRREDLASLVAQAKQAEPFVSFEGPDGTQNRIWVLSDKAVVASVQDAFANTDAVYIADGHHRCASAVRVGTAAREGHAEGIDAEEAAHFLCVLFADDELEIMDYNRVVKDLNGMDAETLLDRLGEIFETEKLAVQDAEEAKPKQKGEYALYLEDAWYRLVLKDAYKSTDPVKGLDAQILQDTVLNPLLGIDDPRTNERIAFVGGIRGLKELEKRCHEDAKVAFALYPTSIAELFAVADADLLMPPKSTWFEPKLLSGLFIHSIKG